MLILPVIKQYNIYKSYQPNTSPSKIEPQFKGKTKFFAFTDIHQNAEKHCKMVNEILKETDNSHSVILDNGDIFKGLFPKYSLMYTYAKAKKRSPNLQIIYNIGNNDPGFMEMDRNLYTRYLNILQKAGVNTISCNVIDEKTGMRPNGIKPYAIVEQDNDKLLYLGFVVNKLHQKFAGMTSIDPITAFEELAPELRNAMKENNCKGMVIMVHDTEDNALMLKKKAKELGFEPEFILGGHVHHPYINKEEKIFYPEPFGESMLTFNLNIDKNGHRLSNINQINSADCEVGIYSNIIDRAKKEEKFDEKIAKSLIELNYKHQDEFSMEYTQLGTLYADGIKGLTNSDVGFVPKSWIYDTMPKKDGYITKLDILLSCPQPFRNIVQLKMTPDELRTFYQHDIQKKSKLFEASQNFELTLDSNKKIQQIKIDGEPLFDEEGIALYPNKIIKVAIDAHTAESINCEQNQTSSLMYDGIVYGLKNIENEYHPNYKYPTAKLNINNKL